MDISKIHDEILRCLLKETLAYYCERLVSLVIFGSVARGTARADSDIDILIVAQPLPLGRMKRVREFDVIETRLTRQLTSARNSGVNTVLSPIFKTPIELSRGTPLMLDMTVDVAVLFDKDAFFESELNGLRMRLKALGAKRIMKEDQWYWDLKPDYKPGEVFAI